MKVFASAKYLTLFPLNKVRRSKDKEVVRAPVVFAQEKCTAAGGGLIQAIISTNNITKSLTTWGKGTQSSCLSMTSLYIPCTETVETVIEEPAALALCSLGINHAIDYVEQKRVQSVQFRFKSLVSHSLEKFKLMNLNFSISVELQK